MRALGFLLVLAAVTTITACMQDAAEEGAGSGAAAETATPHITCSLQSYQMRGGHHSEPTKAPFSFAAACASGTSSLHAPCPVVVTSTSPVQGDVSGVALSAEGLDFAAKVTHTESDGYITIFATASRAGKYLGASSVTFSKDAKYANSQLVLNLGDSALGAPMSDASTLLVLCEQ